MFVYILDGSSLFSVTDTESQLLCKYFQLQCSVFYGRLLVVFVVSACHYSNNTKWLNFERTFSSHAFA